MTATTGPAIGLDIGGANLKLAHSDRRAASRPFALWKAPGRLAEELAILASDCGAFDRIAVTMTGELCDCFATKADGVRAIVRAVEQFGGGRPIDIWCLDGRFRPPSEVADRPELAAASNWLALATVAARLVPEGHAILIDVGTTTTDLIPLCDGRPAPAGRTDPERLRSGELAYLGWRRTPICALGPEVAWRGGRIALASELFATTLDVYLTLGSVAADPSDLDTADGRPATPEAALDRLARMICSDRDEFTPEDANEFAASIAEELRARLRRSALAACRGEVPSSAVISGSGGWIAAELARSLLPTGSRIIALREKWGEGLSESACAWSLLKLLEFTSPIDRSEIADRTISAVASHPTHRRPRAVVKLGGSLLNWGGLPAKLTAWIEGQDPDGLVFLVGGGEIVEAIRAFDRVHSIGEEASHDLALMGLDLTARLVEALGSTFQVTDRPDEWGPIWDAGRVPIFPPGLPLRREERLDLDPLPRSWAVTSDSIAARLARRLDVGVLILIKSRDLPDGIEWAAAPGLGLVDKFFPKAADGLAEVGWLNLRAPSPRVVSFPAPRPERRG